MNESDPVWFRFLLLFGGMVASTAGLWWKVKQATGAAEDAVEVGERAENAAIEAGNLSRPTANGFAASTSADLRAIRDSLTLIHTGMSRVEDRLNDHLSSHARADVERRG